jgi:hypothetical protein
MAAQYRLLRPHYFTSYYAVGTVINAGVDVPSNWVPTLAVDPLNTAAVTAFYAAGPRDNCNEDLNYWSAAPSTQPTTYWYMSNGSWLLSGLGASLAAVPTT